MTQTILEFIFELYLICSFVMLFFGFLIFCNGDTREFHMIKIKDYSRLQILLMIVFLPSYVLVAISYLIILLMNFISNSKLWNWLNQKAFRE